MSAGSWCWKNLFHYGYGFRTLPDYDAIMTGLRRDYDAIWFLMTQLHLAYSPVPYLVGCLAAKELHGASLISLAITLNPSRMSVKYVIGIWVRASA